MKKTSIKSTAYLEGRRDGKGGIPPTAEADPQGRPGFVKRTLFLGDRAMATVARLFHERDSRLLARLDARDRRLANAREQTQRSKNMLLARDGRVDSEQQVLDSERAGRRKKGEHRADTWGLSRPLHVLFLGAIGIGEVKLNELAFDMLSLPSRDAQLLAIAATLITLVGALSLAALLRKPKRQGADRVLIVVTLCTPFLVALVLAVLRGMFLGYESSAMVSPLTAGILLGLLNGALFGASLLLSYFAIDPDRKDMDRERKTRFAARIDYGLRRHLLAWREARCQSLHSRRHKTHGAYRERAAATSAFFAETIQLYVSANQRARDDHLLPECLRSIAAPAPPPVLSRAGALDCTYCSATVPSTGGVYSMADFSTRAPQPNGRRRAERGYL